MYVYQQRSYVHIRTVQIFTNHPTQLSYKQRISFFFFFFLNFQINHNFELAMSLKAFPFPIGMNGPSFFFSTQKLQQQASRLGETHHTNFRVRPKIWQNAADTGTLPLYIDIHMNFLRTFWREGFRIPGLLFSDFLALVLGEQKGY